MPFFPVFFFLGGVVGWGGGKVGEKGRMFLDVNLLYQIYI